ncbi:MAG: tyrosine-type recombinase/integrase [Gemmobacter sp.]|nr:tyrosine-type recombinase/integrase [Gemmobacter sp.]
MRANLGWEFIRTSADPLSDKAMHRWHLDREAEFDLSVTKQRRLTGDPTATPMELCEVSRERARDLLAGVKGLEEDEARAVLAESIAAAYPEDPETGDRTGFSRVDAAMILALIDPDAPCPPPNIEDAKRLYTKEKAGDASTERGRKRRNDIDRVFRLVDEALGNRVKLPLTDLRDADARAVRDHMLQRTKAGTGGETVKASSVRREMNVLSAAWKVALKGFDLNRGAQAVNIFAGLDIPQEEGQSQQSERDPLPHAVIAAMWTKLQTAREKEGGKLPVLRLIWRMLAGTGCRESEIAGLRLKDVVLTGELPHIKVAWHEDRRVKNRASIRAVPLIGDALAAAKEAAAHAGKGPALFVDYYGAGGGNRLSAALMKHLKDVRAGDEPEKQVIHSLRHNMADWLRLSRAETRTENLILGHALGGVGSRVYGGSQADLELTTEAMTSAHARAERDMGTTIAGGPMPKP